MPRKRSDRMRRKASVAGRKRKKRTAKSISPANTVSEETRAELSELQDQLNDLQESLLLTSTYNEMEEIETTLSLLPTEIEDMRSRGYVFRSYLERKVEVLGEQWEETYDDVSRRITRRTRELEREADESESVLHRAMKALKKQADFIYES